MSRYIKRVVIADMIVTIVIFMVAIIFYKIGNAAVIICLGLLLTATKLLGHYFLLYTKYRYRYEFHKNYLNTLLYGSTHRSHAYLGRECSSQETTSTDGNLPPV